MRTLLLLSLVTVLTLGACTHTRPSDVYVFRFEPGSEPPVFRACNVPMNAALPELVAECGKPLSFYPWANGTRCYVYPHRGQAFNGVTGAEYVAVCTRVTTSRFGIQDVDPAAERVVAVFGLRDLKVE